MKLTDLKSLEQYIDSDGFVDYAALQTQKKLMDFNVKLLTEQLNPTDMPCSKTQFCYYVNLYNLLTIQAILSKLKGQPTWQGNLSMLDKFRFFYWQTFPMHLNKRINLYDLENKVIRTLFAKEPRLHMVLNCGSISCPKLPRQWLLPNTLEEVLEEKTNVFVNESTTVDGNKIQLSCIFKWYKEDFDKNGGLMRFLKNYLKADISEKPIISFSKYDWRLNSIEMRQK